MLKNQKWTPKQVKILIKEYQTSAPVEIFESGLLEGKSLDAITYKIKNLKRKGLIPTKISEEELAERKSRAYSVRSKNTILKNLENKNKPESDEVS